MQEGARLAVKQVFELQKFAQKKAWIDDRIKVSSLLAPGLCKWD